MGTHGLEKGAWLSGDLSARKSWTSGPRILVVSSHRFATRGAAGMCQDTGPMACVCLCGCVGVYMWVHECARVSLHVCMSLCECVQCVCENVWVGMSVCVSVYRRVCM